MSRSDVQRQQQKQQAQQIFSNKQDQMGDNEGMAAAASEMFDLFCLATTMRQVLGLHRNMCDILGMRPGPLNEFYPKLKSKIRSWKSLALWKKFDARAAHRVYGKGNACTGTRVLVIGAGPCGLRTAIEAQLLGAKVVVVEKRDRISRNNVLHLWPFVITDLRNLGAKKFYGKFCAGSIDHISIRQLQCILLKVALLLGVEIHEGVSFDGTIEPTSEDCGWRAAITPADHVVSHYEFDVLIGADGKRNTLEGFKRKEFRGKLAIAITANFINKKTEAEAKAEEISGVAFIFNQSFFKELYNTTGIDLENIVYYKDETHYFVMTAKKHSLIDKGVIMQDFTDPAELLAPGNVNTEKLLEYAREAANFSTKYQMPNLEFAVNHYGKPDVAMFDFTSMFAAETSCRVIVRKGFRLLQCLVGDSLLEPFWPTGSGCARGFLSSMDAVYAVKLWANACNSTLGVLAQRESMYRLLNQTTPENLQRDIGSYTIDPATRYPNLNRTSVNVWQVKHLIDTDDPTILEQTFMDTTALTEKAVDTPVRRKRRSGDSTPLSTVLLRWICLQLRAYEFTRTLEELSDVFTNGKVLCALINRYRPDLVDFNAVKDLDAIECNELAFKILEEEIHIPRIMSGKDAQDINNVESKLWINYIEQVCEVFRGEIPHVKHPKMDVSELREKYRYNIAHAPPDFSKLLKISTKPDGQVSMRDIVDVPQSEPRRSAMDENKIKQRQQRKYEIVQSTGTPGCSGHPTHTETPRRAKKRRNAEKALNLEERQKGLKEIEENRIDRQSRRRQQRYQQTQNFYKSLHMLHANTLLREGDISAPFEDYSIFLYRQEAPEFNDRVKELERKLLHPDRDRGDIPSALPRGTDGQFNDRIKNMEQRMVSRPAYGTDKKPKDLMRAIGKIDSTDWNVREIEKKMEQAKKTEVHGPMGREKVPKWSKEQFMARQNKMSKPTRQDSNEEKFKEIDKTLKNLDKQLKEGSVLEVGERGRNKVASIAGHFVQKEDNFDDRNNPPYTVAQKSSSKVSLAFKRQAASEKCHFCKQTVYLMEKTNAEGLIFHRACLKCHHCHTSLRMGGYAFDRDDPSGRFYCTQHYRLPAKAVQPVVRRSGQRKPTQQQAAAAALAASSVNAKLITDDDVSVKGINSLEKLRVHADSVAQFDLLDRGQTPERIEFENADAMSDGEPSEENIIDEHEWSGRNFLPDSMNDSESEITSSDESDSETDSDVLQEAAGSPLGAQTLQLATEWIGKQNYTDSDDSVEFYDSSDGIADDGQDDTEGEEFKKARELRREEVRLMPLPLNLPTDTETEVQSDSESASPEEVELNSATEISTDSEFDHDEIIQETPKIFIDDTHLKKPNKTQMKSIAKYSQTSIEAVTGTSYLLKNQVHPPPIFKPLVQVDPSLLSNRSPLHNPRSGDYLLNKTASTEGIASKKSLELKKRYLLGESANGNKIQKSGSTSVLDSRIRSFQSNISECQKLLNPSNDISASMKTFLERTKLADQIQEKTMQTATNNILNDLKVEITIQKTSPTISNDNEKENIFVNSKNELNKGTEYSEPVNITYLDDLNKTVQMATNKNTNLETIDLVTPEKRISIIDLTEQDKKTDSNSNLTPYSNKIIDLTCDSPVNETIIEDNKPDISKDAKQCIPDILGHIEDDIRLENHAFMCLLNGEEHSLLRNSGDDEKRDSPEKNMDNFENDNVQIEVPNIPWVKRKTEIVSTTSSSCLSDTSSIEDIQHYILDSTTSPDAQNSDVKIHDSHQVPRVEIHDTSGTLMQIDSLMIIDGKYIGDPEDLKYMKLPEGLKTVNLEKSSQVHDGEKPKEPVVKTSEIDEDTDADVEPVTATPEPADCTVIDTADVHSPALPKNGSPLSVTEPTIMQRGFFKFDTKNENKIESLKALPLILEKAPVKHAKVVKPITLNLNLANMPQKSQESIATTTFRSKDVSPISTFMDNNRTPTADISRGSEDSETEHTGTGQVLTETELSDWTADDYISETFIDIEFEVISNKGNIKNNKRSSKICSTNPHTRIDLASKTAPVAEFEVILKGIDLDDIEFMDTGSENSCAETYSATNTALLQNRGYVKFMEGTNKSLPVYKSLKKHANYQQITTKKDEKLGIDYIEQGAYLMNDREKNFHDFLKTPVNEISQAFTDSTVTQSLTNSNILHNVNNNSLDVVTQCTQKSEGLTLVTSAKSPTDSTVEHVSNTMPSSSETRCHLNKANSYKATSQKHKEELTSYEDYVRALQQKITQISNSRDSLDARKHKRKSSKGEESNSYNHIQVLNNVNNCSSKNCNSINKVPEIPSLTSKLEEISKERNKQKDLIHDLVMDKLHSKKQLNAEKRLHRSRQRNLLTSGYSSGASLSPTPKLAAASNINDNNCTSTAHYHDSTAAGENNLVPKHNIGSKENNALQKPPSYVATYGLSTPLTLSRSNISTASTVSAYRHRPFSEHINADKIGDFEVINLRKSPSFSYALPASKRVLPYQNDNLNPNVRINHKEHTLNTSTENLRSEARARARLKSNSELGLSPEEKMQLLRKRLQAEYGPDAKLPSTTTSAQTSPSKTAVTKTHKICSSKSVNDISHLNAQLQSKEKLLINNNHIKTDFLSDPNLLIDDDDSEIPIMKNNIHVKDPERRKSLIQSLSSFFHKNITSTLSGKSAERPGSLPVCNDGGMFSRFRISPKYKEKSKLHNTFEQEKELIHQLVLRSPTASTTQQPQQRKHINKENYENKSNTNTGFSSSSPQLCMHVNKTNDDVVPPPIPPLPLNYQRSDDESYSTETREQKKQRAISKAVRQAELKRLRIAQEIQREQEEIEVQLKDLEARGVVIEKALRGESHNLDNLKDNNVAKSDEHLLKELLDLWRNITQLKKRDEELGIRQQELKLEHRHAQLKEELNLRLSNNKLDKSLADVAAEGAILNEMLEIVAKRAALRPNSQHLDLNSSKEKVAVVSTSLNPATPTFDGAVDVIKLQTREKTLENNESNI